MDAAAIVNPCKSIKHGTLNTHYLGFLEALKFGAVELSIQTLKILALNGVGNVLVDDFRGDKDFFSFFMI